jgi:hypothetical protein
VKLVRPHIPIRVQLEVIARQLQASGQLDDVLRAEALTKNGSVRLVYMLGRMFGDQKVHLDHDPPLCLREIVDAERGIYKPDANDPEFLIYRTAEEHRVKTFIHGEGAQLCDAGKRRKEIRRKRKEQMPRPNRWPPKGSRPLRGRPF